MLEPHSVNFQFWSLGGISKRTHPATTSYYKARCCRLRSDGFLSAGGLRLDILRRLALHAQAYRLGHGMQPRSQLCQPPTSPCQSLRVRNLLQSGQGRLGRSAGGLAMRRISFGFLEVGILGLGFSTAEIQVPVAETLILCSHCIKSDVNGLL